MYTRPHGERKGFGKGDVENGRKSCGVGGGGGSCCQGIRGSGARTRGGACEGPAGERLRIRGAYLPLPPPAHPRVRIGTRVRRRGRVPGRWCRDGLRGKPCACWGPDNSPILPDEPEMP